jgi:hypothetical protein
MATEPINRLATLSDESLRSVACGCCRRMLEFFPADWSSQVFGKEEGDPGGYVRASDWRPDVLQAALDVAEGYIGGRVTAAQLRSAQQSAREVSTYEGWDCANHRLGDSATGAEYEVGYIGWKCSIAVASCCAEDIRNSVAECLSSAAEALGFRWDEAERRAAVEEERRALADLIREISPR